MEKDSKRRILKARLIALGVALLTLAAASGMMMWLGSEFAKVQVPFDMTLLLIINGVGAVLIYFIVSHFLKKSVRESVR